MILILSSPSDGSTNDVIDWLIFQEKKYLRICSKDLVDLKIIKLNGKDSDIVLQFKNKDSAFTISLSEIKSYRYRRDELRFDFEKYHLKEEDPEFEKEINRFLDKQSAEIHHFLHYCLEQKQGFGRYAENYTNKLISLQNAKQAGFIIPETYIVTDRQSKQELKAETQYITKPVASDTVSYRNFNFAAATVGIFSEKIFQSQTQFPSLIQKQIKKKYELRIFHLDEKNFASAIFSQNNDKTTVDFRNYDEDKPNRLVPYKMSEELENSVNTFMKSINMKSGSLDIIVNMKGEFIFLEVNPIGQFGMVSGPCNYQIEKYIAEYLSN